MANDMFKILNPGEQAEFRVSEERTGPTHPLYDASLDSLRNWANQFPDKDSHENIDSLIMRNDNKSSSGIAEFVHAIGNDA